MNNYILISRTFAEITPESCENGDFSNTGFISEKEPVSFRELVDLMRGHLQASCSPDNGDINTWYSCGYYTSNYETGTEREECIHYHTENTPNAAKYWRLARKMANKYNKALY